MTGDIKTMVNRLGLLAATSLMLGGLAASPAAAGGLASDCCADLEERVAELEATTARKGNRKVKLQVYGAVNQAVMFWDDGRKSGTYVVDNDYSSTRFGFKGGAKFTSDLSAGFKVEIQLENANSAEVDRANDDGNDTDDIELRKAYWVIKSKTLGAISVGQNSVATDDLTHHFVTKTSGYIQPDWHYNRGFKIVRTDGTVTGVDIGEMCGSALDNDSCFDTSSRRNVVRYDSPTIAGFKASAAWGEDDVWDVALRFKQKFGQFKFAAAIGYIQGTDDRNDIIAKDIKASASIQHTPTGLFVNGAYVNHDFEAQNNGVLATNKDTTAYYIQAGVQKKWWSLGKTAIWGEYAKAEDGHAAAQNDGEINANSFVAGGATINSTEVSRWGLGVSQHISKAAMELYAIVQVSEFEATVDNAAVNLEDHTTFVTGARIKF